MNRRATTVLVTLLLVLLTTGIDAQGLTIQIVRPTSGAEVGTFRTIQGLVSDPSAIVWVVIHPTNHSGHWVQRGPADVNQQTRTWSVNGQFGERGQHRGIDFEIMAVANPTQTLRTGRQLQSFPAAQAQSEIVTVRKTGN